MRDVITMEQQASRQPITANGVTFIFIGAPSLMTGGRKAVSDTIEKCAVCGKDTNLWFPYVTGTMKPFCNEDCEKVYCNRMWSNDKEQRQRRQHGL
jgi:endogenous inhibitor of DNA gyrase (YacG/DUF329 family)